MKKRKLEVGDIVNVEYIDVVVSDARIIQTPMGAGDLWGYELQDGGTFYLNGNSSNFRGFYIKGDDHEDIKEFPT